MIQHPIPQNVTGYQFRLIGDMTIKQFIYLSVGVGLAIAFYYTNLFFFIKWFFILLSAVGGFAVAFMPLEERPLDQWLVNYFRAIYRPTFFIWQKQPAVPDYFLFKPSTVAHSASDDEISRLAAIRRQQGLRSYLTTLPSDRQGELDLRENAATQNLISLFGAANVSAPLPLTPASNFNIAPPAAPPEPPPLPESPKSNQDKTKPNLSPSKTGVINVVPTKIDKTPGHNQPTDLPTDESPGPAPQPASSTISTAVAASVAPAVTSSSLPFPSAPTTPNTLVGMVLDVAQKIVPGAIVEVVDSSGLPVRATRTNQLGQFFSTTPLKRGTYRLTVDKDNLVFDTIELKLDGQIVEPLKIQAKQ